MKNVVLVLALLIGCAGWAQVNTPASSPSQKVEQKVGLTDVTLEYSRPNMRGRTIFGDLVPYGKVWRTGANANTKITFGDDVMVGGKTLKAGSYAIYTIPNKDSWEILFYSDANNGGVPQNWDDAKVAAKVSAQVYPMPIAIESFTITFDDLTSNSANIGILWENVYVSATFEVPTDKIVMASIDGTMSGPGANDYYSSAVYYLEEGKDMNKAKEWIDKSIEMSEIERFWMFRQKSLIYAKSGDKKGAIVAAKKSLKLAEKAANSDYVALNKKSLKEWGAL